MSTKQLSSFRKFLHETANFLSYFRLFGEKSSLHGVRYIFCPKLSIFERLFWLTLVIIATYVAFDISSQQYERYVANPTVISLERDYREWNGTLPAITICYHKRVDEKKAKDLIRKYWNVTDADADFMYFWNYIQMVVNVNESFKNVQQYTNDNRLDVVSMLEIAIEVHPKLNSVVTSFDTSAEFVLNEVMTEKGICYTVNSVLWPLMSTKKVDRENINLDTKPVSCYFLKNQCYMKLDVYDPTIFIALHSPFEVPSDNIPFFDIGVTDEIEASYNMLETVASDQLRKLRISQRRCYFIDESSGSLPVYSFNACKMLCRAKTAIKLCGCKPYYYSFVNGTICTSLGHLCLNLNRWPSVASCDCSKTCVEIVYTQNSLKKINWAVDGGVPFASKSSFRYEIIAPRMRLKRDVLFSYEDLIVSFGGIAALFLGLNFMGLSDFAFYLFKSFIRYVCDKIWK